MADLIHPHLLTSLHDFFASACTIQSATVVISNYGEETLTWANLVGHVSIPCTIAPVDPSKGEVKQDDMTYVERSHHVTLAGHYPGIDEKMRAIVGGHTLGIERVQHDSQGKTTRLSCRTVE